MLIVQGEPSRALFLDLFWRWVAIFADGDDPRTAEALCWDSRAPSTKFLSMYERFWGGAEPWHPVVPNARLVGVVDDAAEFELTELSDRPDVVGWGIAQVPVTTTPDRAKDDDVVLMGVATSFFVRAVPGGYALEYEIVHI